MYNLFVLEYSMAGGGGGSYRLYLIKYISLYGEASITGASCLLGRVFLKFYMFYGQMPKHSVYFVGNLIYVIISWSFVKFLNACQMSSISETLAHAQ